MWVEGAGINYRRPFLPGKGTTTVTQGGLRGIVSVLWVSGLQQCLHPLLPLVGLNHAPWGIERHKKLRRSLQRTACTKQ